MTNHTGQGNPYNTSDIIKSLAKHRNQSVTRSERKCPIFQWSAHQPWARCHIWQFWSVRHDWSPFWWTKMIPSSGSISWVRRMILADQSLHLWISTQSWYDLGSISGRLGLPKKATRAADADEHENGWSWALIPSTGAGQHTWMHFNQQKWFIEKKVTR